MRRSAALSVVMASAACFATLAVLTRLAYDEGGHPLPLLVWRFAIAAALLGVYLALRSPRALAEGVHELPRFVAMSLTGYGAASLCFFFALRYTSASVATVLLYAYPAIVAFADSVLRREPLGWQRLSAIALTFLGCTLATGALEAQVSVRPLGIVLALGAAAGYALFILLSERMVAKSRLVLMTYTFGLSGAGLAVVALLAGESLSPVGWSGELWGLLGLIVLLPTLAAVLLFLHGVRELGASRTALVSTLEPVFTIVMAAVLLGERLTVLQSVGTALVIAGIVLAEWRAQVVPQPL